MAKIICFEGEHGVGKSCILQALSKGIGTRVPVVRDSEYQEFQSLIHLIRQRVLSDKMKIIKLVAQTRAFVYRKYIDPILEIAPVIFLDRSYYTSAVWQTDDNFTIDGIIEQNVSNGIPTPDRTYIIDAPLAVLLERMSKRGRWDDQGYLQPDQLSQHLISYRNIASRYPECHLIDNSQPVRKAVEEIQKDLATLTKLIRYRGQQGPVIREVIA